MCERGFCVANVCAFRYLNGFELDIIAYSIWFDFIYNFLVNCICIRIAFAFPVCVLDLSQWKRKFIYFDEKRKHYEHASDRWCVWMKKMVKNPLTNTSGGRQHHLWFVDTSLRCKKDAHLQFYLKGVVKKSISAVRSRTESRSVGCLALPPDWYIVHHFISR